MKDVMLDLETLSTKHDAFIVQIGACYFDRMTGEIGETFKRTMTGAGSEKFSIDYNTVRWWMSQGQDARNSVMAGNVNLAEALHDLRDFLSKTEDVVVWSHATFDMPILMNAFDVFNIEHPVSYRSTRDLRTLMDLADLAKYKRERFGIHHDALDDAKFQASYASDAFVKLNHGSA